jgi:hypothetical protein
LLERSDSPALFTVSFVRTGGRQQYLYGRAFVLFLRCLHITIIYH